MHPSSQDFARVSRRFFVGPFLLALLAIVCACSSSAPANNTAPTGTPSGGGATPPTTQATPAQPTAGNITPVAGANPEASVATSPSKEAAPPAPGPQTYKRAEKAQSEAVSKKLAELKTEAVPTPASAPEPAAPAPAPPPPVIKSIPAGTEVTIRTVGAVDSQNADLAQEYPAALDGPLSIEGVVVAPAGAPATLRVVETKKAGRFGGKAQLALRLAAVTVAGKKISVATAEAVSESGSQAARVGKGAAIGGAVGAVAGGILGGSSGAVKGILAGAAAGTAAMALTGPRITVPAESKITFKLSEPAVVPNN